MASALRSQIASTVATGVTAPATPRPQWLRHGRIDLVFIADIVTALILFAITNNVIGNQNAAQGHRYGPGVLLLIALVLCAPLLLRTRLPLTALTASAATILWTSAALPPHSLTTAPYVPTTVIIYGLCMYSVAVRCKAWVVSTAVVVTVLAAAVIDAHTALAAALLTAIPVFAAVIVRSRHSNRQQLEVAERCHEGERALLEERQRIARELHDVVAHHMSVIAIQAEAAPYKTADPPAELVESFADIRTSALSGLGELRRVLWVLRTGVPGTAPQPGLADLDALVDSARSGGVSVTVVCDGEPAALPEGVDLSAYRIVQEALSNAMRHAPGSHVRVDMAYRSDDLALE